MTDNKNGRRWARFTLALALALSTAGNVVHTILADSDISLWLRIPPAALWPVFTFLGIEVLVRIIWQRKFTHRLARALALFPAIPAAIVSYQHLYSLLLLMGEEKFIAMIGPAAIDGGMIGMTMVLLFTRPNQPTSLPVPDIDVDEVLARYELSEDSPAPTPIVAEIAPVSAPPASEPKTRAPRVIEWNVQKVAEMAVDGAKAGEISTAAGISPSVAYRYTKAAKTLKANPAAEIPPSEKVRPEAVRIMRELVSR